MTSNSCAICAEQRDHLIAVGEEYDVANLQLIEDWHHEGHNPQHGPFLPIDPSVNEGWAGKTTQADLIDLGEFNVRPREINCGTCHLIHPSALACEEAW